MLTFPRCSGLLLSALAMTTGFQPQTTPAVSLFRAPSLPVGLSTRPLFFAGRAFTSTKPTTVLSGTAAGAPYGDQADAVQRFRQNKRVRREEDERDETAKRKVRQGITLSQTFACSTSLSCHGSLRATSVRVRIHEPAAQEGSIICGMLTFVVTRPQIRSRFVVFWPQHSISFCPFSLCVHNLVHTGEERPRMGLFRHGFGECARGQRRQRLRGDAP